MHTRFMLGKKKKKEFIWNSERNYVYSRKYVTGMENVYQSPRGWLLDKKTKEKEILFLLELFL